MLQTLSPRLLQTALGQSFSGQANLTTSLRIHLASGEIGRFFDERPQSAALCVTDMAGGTVHRCP